MNTDKWLMSEALAIITARHMSTAGQMTTDDYVSVIRAETYGEDITVLTSALASIADALLVMAANGQNKTPEEILSFMGMELTKGMSV